MHFSVLQLLSSVQSRQFDNGEALCHLSTTLFNQLACCLHSSSSGQQIVHDQNLLSRFNGIFLDLKFISSVFQSVLLAVELSRQLALLTNRHESYSEISSDLEPKQETTSLESTNNLDTWTVPLQMGEKQLLQGSADIAMGQGGEKVSGN